MPTSSFALYKLPSYLAGAGYTTERGTVHGPHAIAHLLGRHCAWHELSAEEVNANLFVHALQAPEGRP